MCKTEGLYSVLSRLQYKPMACAHHWFKPIHDKRRWAPEMP